MTVRGGRPWPARCEKKPWPPENRLTRRSLPPITYLSGRCDLRRFSRVHAVAGAPHGEQPRAEPAKRVKPRPCRVEHAACTTRRIHARRGRTVCRGKSGLARG